MQGHIPGARYVHLDEDLAAPIIESTGRHPLPDVKILAKKLCRWGVGVNKQVVVYDDSFGSMAVRMWWMLRWLGHPGVALLDGGYPKWRGKNIRSTTESPDRKGPLRLPARTDARSCRRRRAACFQSGER